MATAISAPSKLVGARSPIYIGINTTSSVNFSSFFDITLNIKVWDTTISSVPSDNRQTLTRTKFASTNTAVFDIAPIIREYLERTAPSNSNTVVISPASTIVWCRVDFIVNFNNTGGTVTNDTGSSAIFPVTDGYKRYEDSAETAYTDGFLTSVDTIYVPENASQMIPISLGQRSSETVSEVTFKLGATGSSSTAIIDLSGAFHEPEQPEGSVVYFPIGDTNLSTLLTAFSYSGTLPSASNVSAYRLVIGSRTLLVNKVCEAKYTMKQIIFLNRFGVWDTLNCFKASSDTFSVTKESYNKATGSVSTSGVFTFDTDIKQDYNVNGTTQTTLNTGFVVEEYKEIIKELMMSEAVLLDGVRVKVVTAQQTLQKHINDKMINYTLQVEEAFDEIYV